MTLHTFDPTCFILSMHKRNHCYVCHSSQVRESNYLQPSFQVQDAVLYTCKLVGKKDVEHAMNFILTIIYIRS